MSCIGECPSRFRYFKYLRLFFESMDALPKQKRKLWRGLSVDLHKNPQFLAKETRGNRSLGGNF